MSYRLIVQGGGGDGVVGGGDDDADGGVGGSDCSRVKRTNPALDSVSGPYSVHEISVGGSRPSSYPAYTIY